MIQNIVQNIIAENINEIYNNLVKIIQNNSLKHKT